MKSQAFQVSPGGKVTPITLTPEQDAEIDRQFSENFEPDFTPKWLARLRKMHPTLPTPPKSAPSSKEENPSSTNA